MEYCQSRIREKIDVHTHLFADSDCILHLMDKFGVEKSVLPAMGMAGLQVVEYGDFLCFKHARNHPDRLAVLVTFDLGF